MAKEGVAANGNEPNLIPWTGASPVNGDICAAPPQHYRTYGASTPSQILTPFTGQNDQQSPYGQGHPDQGGVRVHLRYDVAGNLPFRQVIEADRAGQRAILDTAYFALSGGHKYNPISGGVDIDAHSKTVANMPPIAPKKEEGSKPLTCCGCNRDTIIRPVKEVKSMSNIPLCFKCLCLCRGDLHDSHLLWNEAA